MMLFKTQILEMLGADSDTIAYASQYYTFIVHGCTFIIFSMVPINLMRTVGHPNASMIASILGAVINIILDPIFIFALGLGAAGAAIATIIGYICSSAFAVYYVGSKCEGLSMKLSDFGLEKGEVGKILAVGLPASVTNFTQTLGLALTNRNLSVYGSDKVATMNVVIKVVYIVMLVAIGLAFGGQPLIGYVYGSGNKERLKKVLAFAYKIVPGTALVMAAVVAILSRPIVMFFFKEENLIKMGTLMLRLQMPGMVLMGVGLVTICTFQSMGKGLPALLLSICRQGVVYAAVITILSYAFGYMGVISSQFVSDIFSVIIAGVLFMVFIKPELK